MNHEKKKKKKKYSLFVAAQNLKRDLLGLLNTAIDGWVPLEDWEETESAHREMFDGMLQAVLTNQEVDHDEPVKDKATLSLIWLLISDCGNDKDVTRSARCLSAKTAYSRLLWASSTISVSCVMI